MTKFMMVLTLLLVPSFSHAFFMTKHATIDRVYDNKSYKYNIPVEECYYFEKNGEGKVMLRLYSKGSLFKKDTDERIHVYISGVRADKFGDIDDSVAKSFYIRVQLHGTYGRMKIYNLKYDKDRNGLTMSGSLYGETLSKDGDSQSIRVTFHELPIKYVSGMNKMHQIDSEYFISVLKGNFGKEWDLE